MVKLWHLTANAGSVSLQQRPMFRCWQSFSQIRHAFCWSLDRHEKKVQLWISNAIQEEQIIQQANGLIQMTVGHFRSHRRQAWVVLNSFSLRLKSFWEKLSFAQWYTTTSLSWLRFSKELQTLLQNYNIDPPDIPCQYPLGVSPKEIQSSAKLLEQEVWQNRRKTRNNDS